MFQLPARRASQRVSLWRKLQKYGALAWKNSAYVLPHSPANQERFQWLAAEVRKYQGEASMIEVSRIGTHTDRDVAALFNNQVSREYERLIRDIRLCLKRASRRSGAQRLGDFARLNRRLNEISTADFFGCGKRMEAAALLKHLEELTGTQPAVGAGPMKGGAFRKRLWMTRPRPGVDRVGSSWLIKHFIDPMARFVFSADPNTHAGAMRFDMFEGEFTHVGDDCTFETLLKRFKLRDRRLLELGELVHDADLGDNKFGRPEGRAVDLILVGWGKMDWRDDQILQKGWELFDALYLTLER